MKDFNFTTHKEFQNEIDLIEDSIEHIESQVGFSDGDEDYALRNSNFYEEYCELKSELRDVRALYQEFKRQNPTTNKPQVDFDLLKGMLRKGGVGAVLNNTYCNPTQDELRNLAVFFEAMKNPKFATKASHFLK